MTLKNDLRNLVSILPKIGLVDKPTIHPHGISFIVPLKDEELWIEKCLLSIMPYADEIIVVDGSVEDKSTKIVEDMAKQYKKIRHLRFYYSGNEAFALSLHVGLVVSRFKYVFKWDADFIASDGFYGWRQRLDNLDPNLYYGIEVARVNLKGDLYHQPKESGWTGAFFGKEVRLFTWGPQLKWLIKSGKLDSAGCLGQKVQSNREIVMGDSIWGQRFPPWYKFLYWTEPYLFHCDIKSPMRRVTQFWWSPYVCNDEGFLTLEEYTEYHVKKDWNMTMEEASEKIMKEILDNTIPYDENKYGKLPKILLAGGLGK